MLTKFFPINLDGKAENMKNNVINNVYGIIHFLKIFFSLVALAVLLYVLRTFIHTSANRYGIKRK